MLGTALLGSRESVARQSGLVGAVARAFDRRARLVLGILALIGLSTLYFHLGGAAGSARSTTPSPPRRTPATATWAT